ncbi:tryptophan--tRNA ligase [Desulfurispira natronophila]|uniref:Tryptophan--tRNA ligase n=1 Tax=Desulfurispira natronophila TaxID=682562 RepID=A0A7W8DI23_9BACT|nr:tryptophan--tRNA ligase [Desulfurispira natronophila]MBB5022908.1 tryptophanyl-tRNA synthetase [Desulfurispira natronophila]
MTTSILSGMRPTGKLHLGNYFGALKNWVDLQEQGFQCHYFVADWHAITTKHDETENIRQNSIDMVKDWLAAGLDPERSTMFVQSLVKQHAELFTVLAMITPVGWLERCPTYKEQKEQLGETRTANYGFLGYPVLQSADILLYSADFVPVGEDQLPHLEITREIARRFNYLYGNVLKEPQAKLTAVPKLAGTDGRKMSKSYGNVIDMSEEADDLWQKVRQMVTDPARVRKTDPGDPSICSVFDYHKLFSDATQCSELSDGCVNASIGCMDCKKQLCAHMESFIEPMRQRRAGISDKDAMEILHRGSHNAALRAEELMVEVRKSMRLDMECIR